MKISYAITVCNEFVEIQKLIPILLKHKRSEDEIVILYDQKNGDEGVEEYLRSHSVNSEFIWHGEEFNNHFADWKNKLTSLCSGDYIFQIDADELPNEGLTNEHIQKWRWRVDEKGWVNWPDYQMRIWKNKPEIKWKNKVHEVLNGHKTFSALPSIEGLALYHPKTIDRQEKQNAYYDTL